MEHNPQARLEYLFNRCLELGATDDEIAELHTLLQQPENEALARKLIAEAHATDDEMALPGETVAAITRAIFQAEDPPTVSLPRRQRGWIRYAAAAAVLLLAGIGGYRWLKPVPEQGLVKPAPAVAAEVTPGNNKAILTLANGAAVVLDSVATGSLARQGGTDIIKLAGGQLAYKIAQKSAEVFYNKITTPHGCQFTVELPDGSRVWLNALSSLRFPTAFKGNERKVELTGEAYFEIAKDPSKPFTVNVDRMQVAVLGTHFNIMAYTDEKQIQTTLLEGAVKVSGGGNTQQLLPGQQIQLLQDGSLQLVTAPDMESTMAWKNGYFRFNKANLQSVMRQLSRWYNIDVVYEGAIPEFRFVGQLKRNASLSANLRILSYSQVNFRLEGSTIIVSAE